MVPFALPAHADASPLVADAGLSQLALDGAALALHGGAAGGTPPYTFAWTAPVGAVSGSSWSSAGVAAGNVDITLSVTDSNGDVATDTVRERVGATRTLVTIDVPITIGAPDEIVAAQAGETVSEDGKRIGFSVPLNTGFIQATLTWPDSSDQMWLDLQMPSPPGTIVATDHSGVSPEVTIADHPARGVWTAIVKPTVSKPTTAHLTVLALDASPLANVLVLGTTDIMAASFGADDAKTMRAIVTSGGTAPFTYSWDPDGDGVYDVAAGSSLSATLALPPGDHEVAAKVTDAAGFESGGFTPVHVDTADHVSFAVCGGAPHFTYWSMEFSATRGTCWIHDAHHTYFMGDHVMAFHAARGYAFSVEQQFAPSVPLDPRTVTDALHRALPLELSMDGTHWERAGVGLYGLAVPADSANDSWERQKVFFDITGTGQPFRFLRVHTEPSLTQGLSGYLDHTQLALTVDDLGRPPAPASAVAVTHKDLSCDRGDNMEDFFPTTHPCWFGGIDRYDAASFYETYPLGDGAALDRIAGNFTIAPFRQDDWADGEAAANRTNTAAYVQVSEDGTTWTDVAHVPATIGVSTHFDVALDHVAARFVRLFPEYHTLYDLQDSRHHPKGYFVHTDVQVDGVFG